MPMNILVGSAAFAYLPAVTLARKPLTTQFAPNHGIHA